MTTSFCDNYFYTCFLHRCAVFHRNNLEPNGLFRFKNKQTNKSLSKKKKEKEKRGNYNPLFSYQFETQIIVELRDPGHFATEMSRTNLQPDYWSIKHTSVQDQQKKCWGHDLHLCQNCFVMHLIE